MPRKLRNSSGRDLLVPRSEWCDPAEIQGNDLAVLNHPVIEKAFRRIIELHKPQKRIAVCSLCTKCRPYTSGRKWQELGRRFGLNCDLIVNSNGGVIPINFQTCYPFLTYDAHGEKRYDAEYIAKLGGRVLEFFTEHRYEYILFLFRPNLRNSIYSETVGAELKAAGSIRDYAVLPTIEQYEASQRERFHMKGFRMFPELYPPMLNPAMELVHRWKASLQESVRNTELSSRTP